MKAVRLASSYLEAVEEAPGIPIFGEEKEAIRKLIALAERRLGWGETPRTE